MDKKVSLLFKIIKGFLRLVYPRVQTEGVENLPDEPCIIVGNHAQMHGPIACELHFPIDRYTWCAAEMMDLKAVPAYAYQDFWADKPRRWQWLYKVCSYLIAPLSVIIFGNAQTIPVHHDARVLSTFRDTMSKLNEGKSIVIFPEEHVPGNGILWQFQEGFVDIARLYYRRTGKMLQFVPLYVAPKLKKMYLGEGVRFDPDKNYDEEKQRICREISDRITDMAVSLPRHTVVPYENLPRKAYPTNTL